MVKVGGIIAQFALCNVGDDEKERAGKRFGDEKS